MKKKKTTKQIIRQIVREEVAMAIQEVITELKQPTQQFTQQPIQEKKNFSKNSVLNDVLNETANGDDWKTLGGSEFTSDRMNELVGGQYGDMMNKNTPQQVVPSSDPMSQFVNKDYREVLKRTDEKQKQKYGK
jgi:Na+-translocating ferredoxin:NAD+ oxidoreductase RnfG subunit